jgi:MFS family permease
MSDITQVRYRLSTRAAFALQTSIILLLLAASSAPTPLYSVFQAKWGFSPITITMVFGVYALAVLAALLTVGKLSDHVGRRPVLLAALAIQMVALAVFVDASDVTTLMIARIVQGLSTGAAVGALGAGLLEIDKVKGTIANGVAPVTGTATGALVSGVFVQYLPDPTRLIFVALMVAFAMEIVGVAVMPETSTPKAGALASLRPQIALPAAARRPLIAAVPALVAVWSLAGFYGALGPTLVHLLSGSDSFVLAGLSLFVLAAAGAVTVYLVRDVAPHRVMLLGATALLLGVGVTVLSIDAGATAWFFLGTAIAGVGFGGGFQGGLRTVLPLAHPHERAGVLSAIYVVSYLALGLPAVVAGVLVEHLGVTTTAREYAAVVMVLAVLALIGLVMQQVGNRNGRFGPDGAAADDVGSTVRSISQSRPVPTFLLWRLMAIRSRSSSSTSASCRRRLRRAPS